MSDRDQFVKILTGAIERPAIHGPRKSGSNVWPEGVHLDVWKIFSKKGIEIAKQHEWFSFAEPIEAELFEKEANALLPALEIGLIDLPFQKCGFSFKVIFSDGSVDRHILLLESIHGLIAERCWLLHSTVITPDDGLLLHGFAYLQVKNGLFGCQNFFVYKDYQDNGYFQVVATYMVGCLSMLLTPEVKRHRIHFKPKVAAQRLASGLISAPITVVQTGAWQNAAKETELRVSGGHIAPRPHLRRGHIRVISEGRKVWVRPCIVAAASDSQIVRRQEYKVHFRSEDQQ